MAETWASTAGVGLVPPLLRQSQPHSSRCELCHRKPHPSDPITRNHPHLFPVASCRSEVSANAGLIQGPDEGGTHTPFPPTRCLLSADKGTHRHTPNSTLVPGEVKPNVPTRDPVTGGGAQTGATRLYLIYMK